MERKRTARKLYDLEGNWVGMELTEHMTLEEAEERYPATFGAMKASKND